MDNLTCVAKVANTIIDDDTRFQVQCIQRRCIKLQTSRLTARLSSQISILLKNCLQDAC